MENKMFIEIAEHAGVEQNDNDYNSSIWIKEFNTSKIGLNQIMVVDFYKDDKDNKDIISFRFTDDDIFIFLKFSDEGMGDYNRIKRILDDKTIR
jgi:hypothetical protein